MKIAIFLSSVILLLSACRTTNFPLGESYGIDMNPPGTLKIGDNLFFDKTEITNFNYLEFLNWMKVIYGEQSVEYKHVLPDNQVWRNLAAGYSSLDSFYLKHVVYRDFPVVGISYEQATLFTNWRTDRVLENFLIERKIIPFRTNVPKDSVFTVEKYFKGQYYGIQPDQRYLMYPKYVLPDSSTYVKASSFADRLNTKNSKYCKKKFCEDLLLTACNCLEYKTYKTNENPYGPDPTSSTRCSFCKKDLITHLQGNVREMMVNAGQFYGYSFIDSCFVEKNIPIRKDSLYVNSFTGFRNSCSYQKWKY